ncbi:sigma-54-dependent Fis family transcriptional regulator [Oxalobacteraceae bacterium A2-2]
MNPLIESSHQRSRLYGLRRNERVDCSPASRSDLSALIEQNHLLHTHAVPAMEALYQQIVNTHNMVILTDASGVIVHTLGDDDFLEKADRVALRPGVTWSEQSKGTNAIGTAIAECAPALVHADQHYLAANHFLTCSAAPISDHLGKVVGVLDVSGDQRSFHHHTMALVRMSALMIENRLFTAAFEDAITLHFHARPEFIGTLMEGIASFSPDGRFLAANRNGQFQLGLQPAALRGHSFSSLFGLPVSELYEHHRAAAPGLLELHLQSGVRVYGRVEIRLAHPVFQQAQVQAPVARRIKAASGLDKLRTGDPQLAQMLDKVARVLDHDIPIMIMGETGTGKELLAQAIHQDSARAARPFVAVNCAAIPETLIESELFGYEDGAFTGARRKGASGRILQANGGTLFLDEIGDMPLSLQARLLRVLQERSVTPLGGARAIPVDVQLVCATNQPLRERIAQGLFREDLYYRLNGLVAKLPPLRERSDIDQLVHSLLGGRHNISPQLLRQFRQHRWPGNLRQLSNLLRTAQVMAGEEREICLRHMPDDFLDDLAPAQPQPASANMEQIAQSAIQQALDAHGGNVSAAARALGVSRNTVYRRLRN